MLLRTDILKKTVVGCPELRQFQVTIDIETYCKHRRKKSIYGGQSRSTEKIIPCTVHLTLSIPIGQNRFARLSFLGFHWHFLNYSELLKTSLQTSAWRSGQFIHATARNKKKRAFTWEIHLIASAIACNAAVFLGAGGSCLSCLCCLCS